MSRLTRSLVAILLALIMSATSISMALARGEMSVHGTMILCLNASQVVVPVGPDGQPQTEKPVCPDCTMGALALAAEAPMPVPVLRALSLETTPFAALSHNVRMQGGQGRGPPHAV